MSDSVGLVEIPVVAPPNGGRPLILADGFSGEDLTWDDASPGGKFLAAMRMGAQPVEAAAYAELSYDTVKSWFVKGRAAWPDDEREIPSLPLPQRLYCAFVMRVERSEGLLAVEAVNSIRKAGKEGDWRASLKLLERRFPERWAPRERLDVSVTGEVTHLTEAIFATPAVAELLAQVEEQFAIGSAESSMAGISPLDADGDDDIYEAEIVEDDET